MAFIHFAVRLPVIQIVLIIALIFGLLCKMYKLFKLIKMKDLQEISFGDSTSSENNVEDGSLEEKEAL